MRRKFVRPVDQFRFFSSHWIFCRESIDTGKPTIKKKEILHYVIVIYFSKNIFFLFKLELVVMNVTRLKQLICICDTHD